MITLITSKKLGGYKIMRNTVLIHINSEALLISYSVCSVFVGLAKTLQPITLIFLYLAKGSLSHRLNGFKHETTGELHHSNPSQKYPQNIWSHMWMLSKIGKNVLIKNYRDKKEVIDAVVTSTFIPYFSGLLPPRYRKRRFIDGGFSKNQGGHHVL